ncbi:MAG: hypothetical protein R6X35_01150 [Candidatus Krumholzibacteriia bacterium]
MPLPSPRPSVLVATAWVLACAAATLAGVALTLAPAEQARAWPVPAALPAGAAAVGPAAAGTAAAAVLLLVAAAGWARARRWEGLFGGLVLVYPLLLAGSWFVLGAAPPGPAAWVAGAVLAAGVALLAWRGPRRRPAGPPATPWRWRAADLVMIGGPAALGLAVGGAPDWRALGVSALFYPLFAAVQLVVFLVVPALRLRAMGLGPTGTALACALVFALLHWPHPAVLALTFAGMFVWASAWLRGRPLWQLALAMGLAATAASQLLPDRWTGHMNVGPRAVRAMAVADLAGGPGPGRVDAVRWLEGGYPLAVGRRAETAELARWRATLAAERRIQIAWEILLSDEYAGLAAAGRRDRPPPALAHWRDVPGPWSARLAAYGTEATLAAAGGTREGFIASLYRDLLGREPDPGGTGAWSFGLDPLQRAHLARYLLTHRLALRSAPWDGASFPPPRLPRR